MDEVACVCEVDKGVVEATSGSVLTVGPLLEGTVDVGTSEVPSVAVEANMVVVAADGDVEGWELDDVCDVDMSVVVAGIVVVAAGTVVVAELVAIVFEVAELAVTVVVVSEVLAVELSISVLGSSTVVAFGSSVELSMVELSNVGGV
eukprot:GDKJ01035065.1.p2 GENE.GDKJ01035065.1~~GDKJ01035065.1.p2  ORF type:complete len:147 (+),score=27.44 GDKJ01035065.1:112-552(+)